MNGAKRTKAKTKPRAKKSAASARARAATRFGLAQTITIRCLDSERVFNAIKAAVRRAGPGARSLQTTIRRVERLRQKRDALSQSRQIFVTFPME